MEEKKKQEYEVNNDFEIEDSGRMKVLRAKGEENENPHESHIPQAKVGWLENFWYLHRWHLGIGVFVFALLVVLVCQIIFNVPDDVHIMYAGPQGMVGRDYDKLEEALFEAMGDYNGDGEKKIGFSDNTFLTRSEIERRQELNPKYTYDVQANNAAYQRYQAEISAGVHMFCMLDPELFAGVAEVEGFVPLSEIFDTVPEYAKDEYGIRLGDTEFYKTNSDIQSIPADTMLGVRVPSSLQIKSEEKKQETLEKHKQLLLDIVAFVPEEE